MKIKHLKLPPTPLKLGSERGLDFYIKGEGPFKAQYAASTCTRCGACLQRCPSFKALKSELYSPRGRSQLLKYIFERKLNLKQDKTDILNTSASCLMCGACTDFCPAKTPVSDLMAELNFSLLGKRKTKASALRKIFSRAYARHKILRAAKRQPALEKEIDFTAQKFYHKKLNSIYIGGGTPTTLNPKQLDRLIRKIKCSFDLQHCIEFTVEAGRPDSITREKLAVLRKHDIDRISINPQTMKQETLDLIGRHHTVEQVKESFQMARELGFDNINMDLIMGLPQESIEDVRNTMEEMKKMGPDNITIHSLAVKRAARLTIFKDDYKDMQMVNTQEHMDLCADYCKEMGLSPYYLYRQKGMAGNMENVGYAKDGKAGVYNILIMEEKQTIMALGAGATTKFVLPETNPDGSQRIERVENVKDVKNYLERVDEMINRKIKKMEEIKWR